jgi:hypothetical protein
LEVFEAAEDLHHPTTAPDLPFDREIDRDLLMLVQVVADPLHLINEFVSLHHQIHTVTAPLRPQNKEDTLGLNGMAMRGEDTPQPGMLLRDFLGRTTIVLESALVLRLLASLRMPLVANPRSRPAAHHLPYIQIE